MNKNIYLRDPLETTLGKSLIKESIILFDEIGFESFNFKKLAQRMDSSEASLYRYFENKYMVLTYLVSWYWDFIHYMVLLDMRNITKPKERLDRAIDTLVNSMDSRVVPDYIECEKLHTIVVENAVKVYHTKEVDVLRKEGFYENYGKLIQTLKALITDVKPSYAYPTALATSLVEQSLNYEYYLEHIPLLTDSPEGKFDTRTETIKVLKYMIDQALSS